MNRIGNGGLTTNTFIASRCCCAQQQRGTGLVDPNVRVDTSAMRVRV
jgi:hypothetical protein